MDASMIMRSRNLQVRETGEQGFSLIEVLISMTVLTVGMVSLLGVFGLAMASTQTSQQDMIAKQIANETLEGIVTARNTSQIQWDDIQNVGATSCTGPTNPCGIFVSTTTPVYKAGADGIFGTSDDSSAGVQTLTEPGPDGIYGTSDDVQIPLSGYQRTILISPVTNSSGVVVPSLRGINITVQYSTASRLSKNYALSTLISQYQ
jgi:prepilin-type N-terminal cleavage/methylation domain-containing protein